MHQPKPTLRLIAAAAIMLVARAPAFAQSSERASSAAGSAASAALADAQQAGENTAAPAASGVVVVTGSRLVSRGFEAPTPLTVVGGQQLEARAVSNIGDFINELPAFRNSTSSTQAQRTFGTGANNSDLRGLGPTSTLVLVNGQRFTPSSPNGTLDMGMVPAELVDRVEVVTGGASAAYGSDAVAGVVNIVLKNRLQGVRASVQYRQSEYGDSRKPQISLGAGTRFADGRGNIVFGVDASRSSGVDTLSSREWGRTLPSLVSYPSTRPAGLAAQGFATGVTYSAQTLGGLITSGPLKGTAFGPGGTPYAFQYGTVYSNLMVGGSNPGGNPFANWPMEIPTSRATALGRLSYQLSDDVEAFAELNYGRTTAQGFTSFNQSSFTIGIDNPFLPAAIKSAMQTNKLSTITVGRLLGETGGLRQDGTRETKRILAGLKGSVWSDWKWDVNAQYGRTTSDFTILQNTITANYRAAVYAVAGPNGQPVCGPVASNPNLSAAQKLQVEAGCIPFNVFGAGSPSQAAIDYVTSPGGNTVTFERSGASANLRGTPFSSWAGPVDVAFGWEFRKDTLQQIADPLSDAGVFSSGNGSTYGGGSRVNEEYAELGLPLARGTALAKAIDLNAAVRHTNYSTSGTVNTWKVGLTYDLSATLRFRATRSRDIRAPSLSELYRVTSPGVGVANGRNPLNGQTGSIITYNAASPDLRPEDAKTVTAGLVFQPDWDWARGAKLALDAYQIKVGGVINALSASTLLSRCAERNASACAAITFDNSTFGIANVRLQNVNQNQALVRGVDVDLSYELPLQRLQLSLPGKMQLRALGSYVARHSQTDLTGTVDRAGSLQNDGVPTWMWNVNLGYVQERVTLNLGARYIKNSIFDAALQDSDPTRSDSIVDNHFPSAVYFNLSGSYDLVNRNGNKVQMFAGIDNLANRAPPQFAMVGINSGGNPYDLIGRVYKLGMRFVF